MGLRAKNRGRVQICAEGTKKSAVGRAKLVFVMPKEGETEDVAEGKSKLGRNERGRGNFRVV
mgnify:CR=1 FL=1